MVNGISGGPTSEAGPTDTYIVDESPQKRGLTIRVPALAALAIAVVSLWLLSRFFWETWHPAASAARRMQSAEASERLKAIRELEVTDARTSPLRSPR